MCINMILAIMQVRHPLHGVVHDNKPKLRTLREHSMGFIGIYLTCLM